MEEMKLTDTETSVHDELDLIPFTDPKLSKVPTDFDFELENPKLLKDKLIEKMKDLGGVGLSALEISKAMGAKVIATAGTDEKLEIAKEYGADYCINYTKNEFKEKVKDITNSKGADIIYDPVGGDVFEQSLRCIAWDGRLLVIGFASGTIAKAPTNLPLLKNCSIVGVFWGAWRERNPLGHNENMEIILKWWQEKKIKPHTSKVFKLEDTKDALYALMNREVIGKAIITIKS